MFNMSPDVQPAASGTIAVGTWTFIQSAIGGPGNAPLVLNVRGGFAVSGTDVILYPITNTSTNELWLLTDQAYIVSMLDSNLCLTAQNGSVVVSNFVSQDGSQQWTFPGDGTIVNVATGQLLTVGPNDSSGSPTVIVAAANHSAPSSQIWWPFPSNPITAILAQPPEAFPVYGPASDTGAAYAYIMEQLASGAANFDLRAQYQNLAAPLGPWLTAIQAMPWPSDIVTSEADWTTVTGQLESELTAVIAVQQLFANYVACHLALFSDHEALLASLMIEVDITTNPTVNGLFGTILWNIVYVLFQANPVTAVVANIIQAGINVSQAAQKNNIINSNAFAVELSALWSQLSAGFDLILQGASQAQITILGDWGMLQSTFQLILTQGSGGLAWNPTVTPTAVQSSQASFEISMLQLLLPTKYFILNTFDPLSPWIPASCAWTAPEVGNWVICAVEGNDWVFPEDLMTNYILGSLATNVNPADFFMGSNGWTTPIAQWTAPVFTTVTITNQTADFVTFIVNQKYVGQYTSPPIPPFQSGNYTWNNGQQDGPSSLAVLNYWDIWLGGFEIYQKNADPLVFSNQWSIAGYQFSSPVIGNTNPDSDVTATAQAIQIAIQPAS